MSSTSIIMMTVILGFYFIGFGFLLNKAFNTKKNK